MRCARRRAADAPLQPGIARKVLARLRAGRGPNAAAECPPPALIEPLTARELDVLRLLGTGAVNRDIAERLSLTEGTVKNYISAILAKTGLRDRTQAALLAVRQGLVD
jgi:DNA-binding NarL/FixJ family response regulator